MLVDLWPLRVTFTFEVRTWVLCATLHLMTVNKINVNRHFKILHAYKSYDPQKLNSFFFYVQPPTFLLQIWILKATSCLIKVNKSANTTVNCIMVINPFYGCRNHGAEQSQFNCLSLNPSLWLWPLSYGALALPSHLTKIKKCVNVSHNPSMAVEVTAWTS